jgi:acylphosphatase
MEPAGADTSCLHAVVRGDVQGVGFRYFVQRRAQQAGLAGWVRNRRDGTVECVAAGPRRKLETLLDELRRGPGMADVESVEVDWPSDCDHLDGFQVRG